MHFPILSLATLMTLALPSAYSQFIAPDEYCGNSKSCQDLCEKALYKPVADGKIGSDQLTRDIDQEISTDAAKQPRRTNSYAATSTSTPTSPCLAWVRTMNLPRR